MKYDFGVAAIESPFPFININKMELAAKVNEHVQLQIWGTLDQQDALEAIMWNHMNEIIKVVLSDGQIYFIGLLFDLEIKEQSGLFQACVTCISASYLLDIYPHVGSYQDVNQSYADIIRSAYRQEIGASLISGKEADVPIGTPVFQYNETEWDLTLRMANKVTTYVIANYMTEYPNTTLGGTESQGIHLDVIDYTVGYTHDKGCFYSCKSLVQLNLGEMVTLRDRSLLIVEKHSVFLNGEFINTYVLGTKEGFSVKSHKLFLSGCRLCGSVLDTDGEKVKLHLDIDKEQDVDKAHWFEFVPQSGNIMYCMPQIGTKAMLRFCSNQDGSAVVEECWRENGQTCSDMNDYNNRYFTSEFGKRMALLPKSIFFQGDGNQAELSDHLGVSLRSSSFTRIIGEEGICIMADKKCRLKIPRHIYITKPNTQSVIDFASNEINIDSINTNITTMRDTAVNKPYAPCDAVPAVSINRSLAGKALAFAPKKSGGAR